MSDLCRITGNKSRNVTTLLAAEFPPLPTDVNGRGDKLISFRTMAYVQANIFLAAPYQTPREDLSQRATRELQALLSTYFEDVLGMKGASGVVSNRPLALRCTPQKPTTDPALVDPALVDPALAVATPAAPLPADPTPAGADRNQTLPRRSKAGKGGRKGAGTK